MGIIVGIRSLGHRRGTVATGLAKGAGREAGRAAWVRVATEKGGGECVKIAMRGQVQL